MIRSMTGYGRSEAVGESDGMVIEVRSLNNRYLDVQLKAPRAIAVLEPRIKKTIQERCARGRFDVFVTRIGGMERNGSLNVNVVLAEQYIAALRDLKSRFGLAGEVELAHVAGYDGIFQAVDAGDDTERLWSVLQACLNQALTALDRMRQEEGAALVRDVLSRLDSISSLVEDVRLKSPQSVAQARKRMTDTLNSLLAEQSDPVRLAQEIALLAERTDITEELTRLDSHLRQFRTMLNSAAGEAIGRKLDFLLQEIGREANTIASKAMDAGISLAVVNIKAEIEKIREQVQNIE